MSSTYEIRLATSVDKDKSPQLFNLLDKAINTQETPQADYFDKFCDAKAAKLVFEFIRSSAPPEHVWSQPYIDWEVSDISEKWIENSKNNEDDYLSLLELGVNSKTSGWEGIKNDTHKLKLLSKYIEIYAETSFQNGWFFLSNEYSSNWELNIESILVFLNTNRDRSIPLYVAYTPDWLLMPTVTLYLDEIDIELFQGVSEQSNGNEILYDRNGYFCGSYNGRPENNMATGDYQFLPPKGMKYKIDWLNESDVRSLKTKMHKLQISV
jgi:hypothetical protein